MRLRIRELTCACCSGRLNRNNTSTCPDCDALLHVGCWEHGCPGEKSEKELASSGSGRAPAQRRVQVRWRRVGVVVGGLLLLAAPFFFLTSENDRPAASRFQPVIYDVHPVLTASPSVDVEASLARAIVSYNDSDFDGALVDLHRAAAESPTDPRVQLYLGLTYYELGCSQVAIGHYTQVIENSPGFSLLYLAYYNRSWNRLLSGDRSGAMADAERAAELSPVNERFGRYMALLHDLSGERLLAEVALREATDLDARDLRPRVWLAAYTGDLSAVLGVSNGDTFGQVALVLRGQLSAGELLSWVEQFDAQHLSEAHFLLGLHAERAGDLPLARGHYAKCIELGGPGDVDRSWARSRLDRLASD